MPLRVPLRGISDNARDRLGCICTFRDTKTGDLLTLHRDGLRIEALHEICALVDELEGDWRCVSYCSQSTILTDVQGGRLQRDDNRQNPQASVITPELAAFGQVGRTDLLDRSLLKFSTDAVDRQRLRDQQRRAQL